MLLGSVQMSGEHISRIETDDICRALRTHKVRLLGLRQCQCEDEDFKDLMSSVAVCRSILHLNLNLGVINNSKRAQIVKESLVKNRSLNAFFLHGSPISDRGIKHILKGVALHPNIVSLDLGECRLSDKSIILIADLLPPNGAKRGLKELTLTANRGITLKGWTELFIAISASSTLKVLNIDYNNIGDYGAGCLAVTLASNRTLEVVDLEACGIEDFGGEVLLNLIKNYPVSLKQLILIENSISAAIIDEINLRLDTQRLSDKTNSEQNTSRETDTERSFNVIIREPANGSTRKHAMLL